jgi:glycosyl transferase family 25
MDQIGGVYYINLDRRTDRRAEMEAELQKLGLPGTRFSAIEHRMGALGCSRSHLAILKEARAKSLESVLILEDDFELLVSPSVFWDHMNKFFETILSYDVLMINYNMTLPESNSNSFLWKVQGAQTTSAYLVHCSFYDTLINHWEVAAKRLEETHGEIRYVCDRSWKVLQAASNEWYAFKTRMGQQRASYSDIEQKRTNYGC